VLIVATVFSNGKFLLFQMSQVGKRINERQRICVKDPLFLENSLGQGLDEVFRYEQAFDGEWIIVCHEMMQKHRR
jgi:hypothetical protein